MDPTHACASCKSLKPVSEFSKTQLAAADLAKCKSCTGSHGCEVCGVRSVGVSHNATKKHLLNLELSQTPGYIMITETKFNEQRLRATGLVRKDTIWVSSQNVLALRTIAETGVPLSQFKAINVRFSSPKDLVQDKEHKLAASLMEVKHSGVELWHFRRASQILHRGDEHLQKKVQIDGTYVKWCTPAQLDAALKHREQCTIIIKDTGLKRSRFKHLGICGSLCSRDDLVEATALVDATKSGIPLNCFDDADGDYLGESSRRADAHNTPIWVTPAAEYRARDQFDGASILHYLDNEHLHDF